MHDDIAPPVHGDGFYVLVVEDELLIATEIEMILKENGHTVAGPAATVDAALRLLERERPQVAVLDVNLRDQLVVPIAERLRSLNIPYVLSSACIAFDCEGAEVLVDAENVGKPFDEGRLMEALRSAVGRS